MWIVNDYRVLSANPEVPQISAQASCNMVFVQRTAMLRGPSLTISHLCAGERHRDNVLQAIGSSLEAWVTQVKREKAVYHVLNMCSVDVTRKVLVAEAWCPVSAKPRVQEALREAAHTTSASVRPFIPL